MTEIFDMIDEIKNFKPFLHLQVNLLQFKNNIRSKLWTIEILTNHINDIIHDFIISDYDDISSFFIKFIQKLYPHNQKRQRNYCYTLILSLIYYKQNFVYLNLYHDLFTNHKRKNFYEFIYDCKEMIFQQQNRASTSYAQLDQIYLDDKEWIYVVNQMLGLEREDIKYFRDDMQNIVMNLKRKKANYLYLQKSQQFSLYFFLSQVLRYYRQIELAEKEEKIQMLEQFKQRASVKSEEDLESSIQHEQLLQKKKLYKKQQLIERLKETVKTTNRYKSSCITLMTYLHEIDPIFLEIKNKIQIQKDLLNQIKQSRIQGKKYEEFVNKVQVGQLNFLERGSSLFNKNSKELLKILLNEDVEIYKMLTLRQKEKIPSVKRLIKNLRKKIFHEQFTLFQEGEGKNMDNLKKELEKIFGKFQNLKNSDYVILNTYFNNYDSNHNKELKMENLLDKVSAKILKIVDRALDESGEQIQEESLQSISRSSQNISKVSSKKVNFKEIDKQSQQQSSKDNNLNQSKQSKLSSLYNQDQHLLPEEDTQKKLSFQNLEQIQDNNIKDDNESVKQESIKQESIKEQSSKRIQDIPIQKESSEEEKISEKKEISETNESEADDDYINRINQEVDVQHKKATLKEDKDKQKQEEEKQEKQKQMDKIAEKRVPQFMKKKASNFNVLDLPMNSNFKPIKLDSPKKQNIKPIKKDSPQKSIKRDSPQKPIRQDSPKKSIKDDQPQQPFNEREKPIQNKRKSKFQNLQKTDMNDEGDKFSNDFEVSPKPSFHQTQDLNKDTNRQSKVSFNQTTDLGVLKRKNISQNSKKSLRKSRRQKSKKSNLENSQLSRKSIQSRSSRRSKRSYMQMYQDRKSLARNQSKASIKDSHHNVRDSISPSLISPSLSNRNDINLPIKKNPYEKIQSKKSMSKKSLNRHSNLPPRQSMKNNLRQSKGSLAKKKFGSKVSLKRKTMGKEDSYDNFNQTKKTELIDTEIEQTKRTEMIDTEYNNDPQTELINSEDRNSDTENQLEKKTEIIDTQIDQQFNNKEQQSQNSINDDNKRNTLEIQTNDGKYVENELINTYSDQFKNLDQDKLSNNSSDDQGHQNYSDHKENLLKDSDENPEINNQEDNKNDDQNLQQSQQQDSKQSHKQSIAQSNKDIDKQSIYQSDKQSQKQSKVSENFDQIKKQSQQEDLQESSLKQIMVDSEVVDQPLENKRKESKKNSMRETGIQFQESKFDDDLNNQDHQQENRDQRKRLSTIEENKKSKLSEDNNKDKQQQDSDKVDSQKDEQDNNKEDSQKDQQHSNKEDSQKDQQDSNKEDSQNDQQEDNKEKQDSNKNENFNIEKSHTDMKRDLLESEEQIFVSNSNQIDEESMHDPQNLQNLQRISQLEQSELFELNQSRQMKNLESVGKNVIFEEGYQQTTDVNSLQSNKQNVPIQNSLMSNEKKFTNLENFDDFKQNLDQINSQQVDTNADQTIMISNPKVSTDRKQNDGNESINALIGNLDQGKEDIKDDKQIEEIPEEEDSKNILPDESEMINESLQHQLEDLGLSESQKKRIYDSQNSKKLKRNIKTKKGQAIAEKVGLIDTDKKSVKNFFKNIFKQFYKFKFNEQEIKIRKEQTNLKIIVSIYIQTKSIQIISKKNFITNVNLNLK